MRVSPNDLVYFTLPMSTSDHPIEAEEKKEIKVKSTAP